MRSRIIAALAAVCLVAAGVGAALLNEGQPLPERYVQHEKAQHLEDLSAEDQAAASSTSTDPETFASHLPVISIDTGGQEIPDGSVYDKKIQEQAEALGVPASSLVTGENTTIGANIRTFDKTNGANRLTDSPSLESECQIRIRGNSSRAYAKKNYQIVLTKSDGTDNDQELLGMDRCETWVLHGPAVDKTLIRNYFAYNIAGQFMKDFVPDVRFCELFIDGEYKGLYVLTESIKVEQGRIQLNEPDQNDVQTSYVIAIDEKYASETTLNDFLNYTGRLSQYMDIVYPNEEDLSEERKAYIESDVSRWEKALFSYDYDTSSYGYWTIFDVDSCVDAFVFNEFVINDDYGAYSTFAYKDVRGKVVIGPPWDYDNTFDNYSFVTPVDKFYMPERVWYGMLLKDEAFCEDVISRYRELREDVLSDECLSEFIDQTIDYLGPAIERNWERWGSVFADDSSLVPHDRRPQSYDEALADFKSFVSERGAWLDGHIEQLRQYSHESAVKKYNH